RFRNVGGIASEPDVLSKPRLRLPAPHPGAARARVTSCWAGRLGPWLPHVFLGARDRADAARKALMLAADTAIPPQKSSSRGAARLGPRTSRATWMPTINPSSLA